MEGGGIDRLPDFPGVICTEPHNLAAPWHGLHDSSILWVRMSA